MLINYVRNKQGNRIGVVVATGASKIGWSLCNHKDNWDRKKGLMIAKNRAERGFNSTIPKIYNKTVDKRGNKVVTEVMVSTFNHMIDRAQAYFQA